MTYLKKCKICNSEHREKIEALILLDAPRKDIEKYGVNRANIITHIKHNAVQDRHDRSESIREEDRLRTLRMRKKHNVTEDDFEEVPRVRELKRFMKLFRPWLT